MFGSGFLGGVAVVLSGVPGFWGIVPGCSGVPGSTRCLLIENEKPAKSSVFVT